MVGAATGQGVTTRRARAAIVVIAVAAVALAIGCRRRADAPADAAPLASEVVLVADDPAPVLYVDVTGEVRTARGVASVPAASRHAVALDGPDGPGGAVWIADASTVAASWPARRGTRLDLERLGLAGLPPGLASRVTLPDPGPPGALPPPAQGVVVYGTRWCGACADTRAWLDARGVAYRFRDVDDAVGDPGAALDAARACAAVGAPDDRVPVIDVAGRVLVGFDPVRLTVILGQPI